MAETSSKPEKPKDIDFPKYTIENFLADREKALNEFKKNMDAIFDKYTRKAEVSNGQDA